MLGDYGKLKRFLDTVRDLLRPLGSFGEHMRSLYFSVMSRGNNLAFSEEYDVPTIIDHAVIY